MFQSAHDGDHDGVVRIFVGFSCELWFLYYTPGRGKIVPCYTPGRGKIVPRNVNNVTLLVGEKLFRVI